MCKSKAEGGRRCAAHLAPAYIEAINAYKQSGILTPENISAISLAATQYASTPFGYKKVKMDMEDFVEEEKKKFQIDDSDFGNWVEIINDIYSSGIVSILNESTLKGYSLRTEYDEKEREIARLTNATSINASLELVKAFDEQDLSINTFFSAIRVARALGADIPAIEGTSVFESIYEQGVYDDWHQVSLGFYPTQEEALLAQNNFIFADLEDALVTPWGDLSDYSDPEEWDAKRIDYFKNHLDEVIAWYAKDRQTPEGYEEGRDFSVKHHIVEASPTKAWEARKVEERSND